MTDSVPNYCAEDGTELTVVEQGVAVRATCSECGERWYGFMMSALLWRLPPTVRTHVDAALRWWFDRPRITPVLSMLRAALAIAPLVVVSLYTAGGTSVLFLCLALAGFFSSLGMAGNLAEGNEHGPAYDRRDAIQAVAVGVPSALAIWYAETGGTVTLPDVGGLPTASALGEAATAAGLVLVAVGSMHLTWQVTLRLHERLHWLAFKAIGVPARIEYSTKRVAGIPIGVVSAETIPQPASWTGREWEHLVTGFAPLLLMVPLLVGAYLDVGELVIGTFGPVADAVVVGVLIATVASSLPSAGDLGVVGTSRYRTFDRAGQARQHRFAEGFA